MTVSMPSSKNSHLPLIILMTACVFFALLNFLRMTAWGVGLTTDSLTYLQGARSILETHGLQGLTSHYPPLYSLLLALAGLLCGGGSAEVLTGARFLQGATLALQIAAFGLILWHGTQRSLLYTALGMLVLVSSPVVMQINGMAWTEGLYSLLAFCALALLGKELAARSESAGGAGDGRNCGPDDKAGLAAADTWGRLICAAGLAGCAGLTRYVGVILILCGALLVLVSRVRLLSGLVRALVFGLVSGGLLGGWLLHNMLFATSTTGRSLVFHPVDWDRITGGIAVLLGWFHLPGDRPALLAVVVLVIGLVWLLVSRASSYRAGVAEACGCYIPLYLLFLLFSISFVDAHTPLDGRILYPLYLPILMVVMVLLQRLGETLGTLAATGGRIVSPLVGMLALSAAMLAFCLPQFYAQANLVSRWESNGAGFAARPWVESPTLQALARVPVHMPIYTNGPDPISFYLGRPSTMIPRLVEPLTRQKNTNFSAQVKAMAEHLKREGGLIVYFANVTWRWYLPDANQLLAQPDLADALIVFRAGNDVIFQIYPEKVENVEQENESSVGASAQSPQ